eukprot:CAMPEP_0201281636 /NCGR_PEP_ID=MMETSP1317-20130820/3581_1 /ASSEMBLY_ACC=CAM_ASM_000770 /TAXON_ID=187299 /ORGANISM="Undescribed Undescribed, Strain Undescribed" /LENGTH=58 /DNA_ID=CAMNT_0047592027 /DNA_START=894 /DNA_END=1070 /DNA_ORIENTATION=+
MTVDQLDLQDVSFPADFFLDIIMAYEEDAHHFNRIVPAMDPVLMEEPKLWAYLRLHKE